MLFLWTKKVDFSFLKREKDKHAKHEQQHTTHTNTKATLKMFKTTQNIPSLKRRLEDFCTNVRKRSLEIANEDDPASVVVVGGSGGGGGSMGQCPIRRKRFRRAKDIVKSAVADSANGLSEEDIAFMGTPEYLEMMQRIEEEISRELSSRQETEDDLLRAYEDSQEFYSQTSVTCPICQGSTLIENPGVWIQCPGCGLYLVINDPTLNAEYLGRMVKLSYENHAVVKGCPMKPEIKMSPDGRCLVFVCGACSEYNILI